MRIKYKAIFAPENNRRAERLGYQVVDAMTLAEIPSGSVVIYRLYDDGSAEIYSEKKNKDSGDQAIFEASKVYLEPKHDG